MNNVVNKETLKGFFKNGLMPTEGNFHSLIDSMYNRLDDDILSTFIENTNTEDGKYPTVFAKIENDTENGLSFNEVNNSGKSIMQMVSGGNVGIGVVAPLYKLHVNGTIAAPSRIGTYTDGISDPSKILANGKWQSIIKKLNGLNAFEIVASVSGVPKSGDYALLHAIALSTFGNSKNCIVQHTARFKGLLQNIELRWTGDVNDYNLEIRTRKDFGNGIKIKYNITQLICE
ncbi:MAG: hypothetical protein ACK50A_03415 [Sphingobacteriaceae bacterium]